LLVSEESVISLVEGQGQVAALATTDDAFVRSTLDHYDQQWDDATAFTLRTPPLSTVMSTLEEKFGPETASDFRTVLDSLDTEQGEKERILGKFRGLDGN